MSITEFTVILASDQKHGIAQGGKIPWRLKGDMKHFKKTTTGLGNNAVIMGRKTWESLPEKFRPLPDRLNIVMSRHRRAIPDTQALLAHNFSAALSLAKSSNVDEIFVIGGGEVYAQALNHLGCARIIRTVVNGDHGCDQFCEFPPHIVRDYHAVFEQVVIVPAADGDQAYRIENWEQVHRRIRVRAALVVDWEGNWGVTGWNKQGGHTAVEDCDMFETLDVDFGLPGLEYAQAIGSSSFILEAVIDLPKRETLQAFVTPVTPTEERSDES